MDALSIVGGSTLSGTIRVSGSKNASLPIIAAALLAADTSHITNIPELADIKTLCKLLEGMGCAIERSEHALQIQAVHLNKTEAPYELVRTMRASILVLGPLLARMHKAKVSLPGGCAIGARPVDQHLKALEQMGANMTIEHGYVLAEAPQGLKGANITFDMPTVTGTENIMMAATLAQGTTTLHNCAQEPEIVDLAVALKNMGAIITGAGTPTIRIEGQKNLRGMHHNVIADRIEFGTFLIAGALAGQQLRIEGGILEHQAVLIDILRNMGCSLEEHNNAMTISKTNSFKGIHVATEPYPGFPTDMQAQLMTLLCFATTPSMISENIFENRFMHVAELNRLGANIRVDGGQATVYPITHLSGTTVMATDLRASACLVMAGLVAQGETVVRRIYHLDRGYEHVEQKLKQVGAKIIRFKENE